MKKIRLAILSFLLVNLTTEAQQLAQYTMYSFNHFGINPAAPGDNKCISAKLSYRNQWTGFEGNPITQYLSLQAPIPQRSHNFRRGISSTGLYFENDQTGPTRYTGIYLNYAYHQMMAREWFLSFGVFAGTMQYAFDRNVVKLASSFDPAVNESKIKFVFPDINPGIWLHNSNFYAGLSIKSIVGNSLTKVYGVNTKLTRHYYLNAGWRWLSQDKSISIIPSAMLKFSPYGTPGLDVNIMYDYMNMFDLGISYRSYDAVAAMFKVRLGQFIYLGYSFDYNTSQIRIDSHNSHEILLQLRLCKAKEGIDKPREICPAYQ